LPDPYDADDERAQSRTIDALASLFDGSPPPELARIDHFDRTWAHLVAPSFDRFETPMKNYMAARVFANWIAYQGRGLRTIVEWLRTCAAVVRHYLLRRAIQAGCPPSIDDFVEAVRMADLLLLHTIDTQAFARRCAAAEGPDPR
jgi:hypothetical protein